MTVIKSIKITWLSPRKIEQLSFGKIINHKTINTRTLKPEPGGLFDSRVFGPFLNYECYCGKYKGKQNKGQKCERCETLITEKNVQRWRMGHIVLTSPVTNILIFKNLVTNLSKLLKISTKNLEDIIYFRNYVVIDNGLTALLKKREILGKKIDINLIKNLLQEITEDKNLEKNVTNQAKKLIEKISEKEKIETNKVFLEDYLDFLEKHRQVKIGTGTEAFQQLLKEIDIKRELEKLKEINKKEALKGRNESIKFLEGLRKTGINLEWMIIYNLPLIPCGLRPVTKLEDEETIATSRDNNSYRKVILINERLNYYLELNKKLKVFFSEIIHNEKKRLQKAIDQLIQGSSNKKNDSKSLSQSLSGKEGILRRHSLGKRVDYSARSVIIPNPNLSFDQIGLPVTIALTLFKPFVIQKILKEKNVFTFKEAEQLISQEDPIVFSFLNEIVQNHPILVNRAPSLHRPSIQGFYPKLTFDKAIGLHPKITIPLNADFDGDQTAIHLPLTKKAREEVKNYILSPHHILDPKNGQLITIPSQDMILGIYYLTKENKPQEIFFFDKINDVEKSYYENKINLHDLIIIPARLVERNFNHIKNQFLFTTLGKIIFNRILPSTFSFYINDLNNYNKEEEYNKIVKNVEEIEKAWKKCLPLTGWKKKDILTFLNKLVKITPRDKMIEFLDKLKKLGFNYATYSGISISPFEIEELADKKNLLKQSEEKIKQIDKHYSQGFYNEQEYKQIKINIWQDCKDQLQEKLTSNLEENNHTSLYYIWDSGARASSENLTQIFAMRGLTTNYLGEVLETPITSSLREGLSPFEFFISVYGAMKGMIDIALKTAEAGYLTRRLVEASQTIVVSASDCQTTVGSLIEENDEFPLVKRAYGRYLVSDISNNKEVILTRNTLILENEINIIKKEEVKSIRIRSPLNCELVESICQKCYGLDLSKVGEEVKIGVAVGIIAAQSLGEPGTQLTMRTFHGGGISGEEDITQGLPKVKQILDNINPEREEKAVLAKKSGIITSIEKDIVRQKDETGKDITYSLSNKKNIRVNQGDIVKKGDKITSGSIDLEEYLEIMGRDTCQNYIKEEIRNVYSNQGIEINEKHIEIFARQMLSRIKIEDNGDSDYLIGDIVNYQKVQKTNQSLIENGGKPITFKNIISSLKDLASTPESFLAGISFQNTIKSLINYSLYNPVDYLKGAKESLIAGQLTPIGEGLIKRERYPKFYKKRVNEKSFLKV